jgi:hypothetical protein
MGCGYGNGFSDKADNGGGLLAAYGRKPEIEGCEASR